VLILVLIDLLVLALALVLVPVHCMHRGRCHGCFGEETLAEQRRIKKEGRSHGSFPAISQLRFWGQGGYCSNVGW
jgi:hypothetical protein